MSGRTQHWLVVSNGAPSEHEYDNANFPQQVGYCGDTFVNCNNIGTARSYFQMDTSPLLARNGHTATIRSAYFYATEIHQYSNCVDEPVNLYEGGGIGPGTGARLRAVGAGLRYEF